MRGRISALGIVLLAALSGTTSGWGCGGEENVPTLEVQETIEVNTVSNLRKLALCPAVSRDLVCGKNGRTYPDLCAAGGLENLAHDGACADFVCNGAVCARGFLCRSSVGNGGPLDRCVAD